MTGLTVFTLTPFVEVIGSHPLWTGPTIPVVGTLVYLITRPAYPMPRHPQPAAVAGTLTELKSMHAAGVLNDQQYEEQRAHLLAAA